MAQLTPASNLERFQVLADSFALDLCGQLQTYRSVSIIVEPHPARWLAEHAIVSQCAIAGIVLLAKDTFPRVHVALLDVGVSYEALSGERVRRLLRWGAVATLRLANGQLVAFPPWQRVESDTLPYSLLGKVDHPGYPFTTAPVPQWHSFWHTIAEPAIALVTGGVIVLLLFALRTR